MMTITSSNFKRVACSKKRSDSLLTSLFSSCTICISNTPSIRHGRINELVARQSYQELKAGVGKPVDVVNTGLVLHTRFGFLGASPDGLVQDRSMSPCFGLLEIKCPYRPFMEKFTVEEACGKLPDFCCELKDGKAQLKRSHAYFYQLQGQMAIYRASWCDFFCLDWPICAVRAHQLRCPVLDRKAFGTIVELFHYTCSPISEQTFCIS